MTSTIRIAITPGEPAGIGPDLVIMAAQQGSGAQRVVITDPELLTARAHLLGLKLSIREFDPGQRAEPDPPGVVTVLPCPLRVPVRTGHPDAANAEHVLSMLRLAVDGCLDGRFQGMVTGPVQKGVINDAGIPFTGHTEFLAQYSGAPMPVMLLAAGSLRVALATTHLPLREVSAAITGDGLEAVLRVLDGDLRERFGIPRPHILVCGLNPHAGEGGHLGREEIEVIGPALEHLRAEGMHLSGPLPADTLFTPRYLEHADAVLAMYHDQGLPVLKHAGFGRAVNITLGLPIIRTSVDHGTALDLAGTGRAEVGSFLEAESLAIELARQAPVRTEPISPNPSARIHQSRSPT